MATIDDVYNLLVVVDGKIDAIKAISYLALAAGDFTVVIYRPDAAALDVVGPVFPGKNA